MRWLDDITDTMDMRLSKLHKIVKDREACLGACEYVTLFGKRGDFPGASVVKSLQKRLRVQLRSRILG